MNIAHHGLEWSCNVHLMFTRVVFVAREIVALSDCISRLLQVAYSIYSSPAKHGH